MCNISFISKDKVGVWHHIWGVAIQARCNHDFRICNLWVWEACVIVITLHLTIFMQLKCSFSIIIISIVITLQLTIFMQLKCSFSIFCIFNFCHFETDHPHVGKLIAMFCFITANVFTADWHDQHGLSWLNTANNVFCIKFPSGSWMLVKIENV